MLPGLAGMSGNLAATVPLVLALGGLGWTTTFAITGATSLVYTLLLLRPACAAPYRHTQPAAGREPAGEGGTGPDDEHSSERAAEPEQERADEPEQERAAEPEQERAAEPEQERGGESHPERDDETAKGT